MLSPKNKRNLRRIIPVAIIWFFFGMLYVLIEKGILADLTIYPSTNTNYSFKNSIMITSISSFLTGMLIGALEICYLYRLFNRFSFGVKMALKTIIYMVFIILFLLILSLISNSVTSKLSLTDPLVIQAVEYFVRDFAFWSVALYIGSMIIISLFVLEVSNNLGSGVLGDFLTGKYHKPIQEARIFMFLDMKSSTTIAENLGHVKYFKLLNAYYAAMGSAIVDSLGEIYQYVGDEIVVSWPLQKGLKNYNCICCFFRIKEQFKKRAKKFERDFGIVPTFKAGFHYGTVTTGEIGEVKKEILFTGDVLNTTARIQSLCNEFNAELLISGKLLSKLELPNTFNTTNLGEKELRGKGIKVLIHSIEEQD